MLLDVPRLRGVDWLEPGDVISRAELEAAEQATGLQLEEGDILFLRTGHYGRRLALGPWSAATQKAGLHPHTMPLLHERKIAAAGLRR